ncbi:MAG TPA: DNA-directed RNA polymerase subunit alpha [Candidatus Cloacimonetes bacterium]|nr:DNA-directed RNA polymerase subunit alpha [Candidatus Cloacimonadota bacterium]HEX37903.1 DNA-directed RNA polymerase subunit alpha [Candidatus Cloacimonadota bacterium]
MVDLEPIQLPTYIKKEEETYSDTFGKFTIGPFEQGFGTTIGNAFRRVLLSSIQGGAVRFVKVKGLQHQYTAIPGAREDYIELILNLKNLVLKIDSNKEEKLELSVKGPKKITADMISTPKTVEIINKDLYLLELVDKVEFEMELWAGNGIGYVRENEHDTSEIQIGVIPIDSIYSPIRKVNFHVGRERVDEKIDYDKTILEIWTDGSITPENALSLSAKILKDCFQAVIQFKEEPKYIKREKIDPELKNLQKLMKMKVTELELSVRCSNCLAASKIEYVKELVAKTESQLLRLRNFGKKSLDEVKTVLDRYGLKLGMDIIKIDEQLETLRKIEEQK